MLTRILLYLKHHTPFIWSVIEKLNSWLFKLLYETKFNEVSRKVIAENHLNNIQFRSLAFSDLTLLHSLIQKQFPEDLIYFKPHGFDEKSLLRTFNNPSFLMMGAFVEGEMKGYFFLRCFWTRKCFVGRLVDKESQGRGIGKGMNDIMYNIAWQAGFRCLSTISKNNKAVMTAHAKNESMVILKELDNNYLLVEFVKKEP